MIQILFGVTELFVKLRELSIGLVRVAVRRVEIALLGLVDIAPESLGWVADFRSLRNLWLGMQEIRQVLNLSLQFLNFFFSILPNEFVIELRNLRIRLVKDADEVAFFHGAPSEILFL